MTGMRQMRAAEIALGMVKTFRLPDGDTGLPRPPVIERHVQTRRAGRIRTGDLLTPSQTR